LIARVAIPGSCLGDTSVDSEPQGVIDPPTTVSDDDELDSVVLPPARDGNPLNKRFMPLTTCLQILRDNSATLDSVPTERLVQGQINTIVSYLFNTFITVIKGRYQ